MDFTFFAQYQGFEFHCSPVRMPGGGFMPRLVVSADFGATRVDIPVSAPWARTAPPFSPMPAGEACIVVRTWTRLDASNLSGGSDVGALSSHRLATGERPNPTLTSARDSAGATDRATPAMPRFAQNNVGRDFAEGDIHGCFTVLHRGLDAIGFDPTADRLFSVGDLVDRGPESHLALRWMDNP